MPGMRARAVRRAVERERDSLRERGGGEGGNGVVGRICLEGCMWSGVRNKGGVKQMSKLD